MATEIFAFKVRKTHTHRVTHAHTHTHSHAHITPEITINQTIQIGTKLQFIQEFTFQNIGTLLSENMS